MSRKLILPGRMDGAKECSQNRPSIFIGILFYGVEGGELSAAGKSRVASEVRGMVAWLVLESGKLTHQLHKMRLPNNENRCYYRI